MPSSLVALVALVAAGLHRIGVECVCHVPGGSGVTLSLGAFRPPLPSIVHAQETLSFIRGGIVQISIICLFWAIFAICNSPTTVALA